MDPVVTRSLKIIVVEDYDDYRAALCAALIQDGHDVMGVANAEDVDDEPIGYVSDLYIVDINLPGEDGMGLARRIRNSQPDVGIVIISARNTLSDRIDGYQSGANIYLTKPFSLEELRAVVFGFSNRLTNSETALPGTLYLNSGRMIMAGPVGKARLTQTEVVLLAAFSRVSQQTLERWQVASHLGGGEHISRENLEVKIGRLRKKLITCGADAPAIQSLRGLGYKLCIPIRVKTE